ncbi:hypothetical protein DID80_02205 [Candidatus Marinamargulisbacteria bacterium SCGC AAA071-K20]|nr:hypothetical protein DID80_02205 [Candidatus Marinamargulisbacteria bacterium SCGC AAA071-K20]
MIFKKLYQFLYHQISPKQIILKNSLWMGLSKLISSLLKFALIPIAANILGPEQFGQFNYTISLLLVYFTFADLGLAGLLVRVVHQSADTPSSLRATFTLKLILLSLSVMTAVAGFFLITDTIVKSLFILFLAKVSLDNLKLFFYTLLGAYNRLQFRSITDIVEASVVSGLGLFLLFKTSSLYYFTWAYVIGSVVGCFLALFFALPYLKFSTKLNMNELKRLLKMTLPLFGISLMGSLLLTSDTLMIKWLKGLEEVGFYTASLKILELVSFFYLIINSTLYPFLTKFYKEATRFFIVLRKGFMGQILLAIPITFGGIFFAENIILHLYSDTFLRSAMLLKILLIGLIFFSTQSFLSLGLLALNKEKLNFYLTSSATILNIILNLAFIPTYGALGAVWGTVLSRSLLLLSSYYYINNFSNGPILQFGSLLKIVTASLLLLGFHSLSYSYFHYISLIIISMVLYPLLLILFKEKYSIEFFNYIKKNVSSTK